MLKKKLRLYYWDKDNLNINQGGFTFLPFGLYTEEDIKKPRSKLISPRVKTAFGLDGEVSNVNLEDRKITVKSGKEYSYDYLLIATGCRVDVESILGLPKDYDTFYTLEGALKLRETLKTFEKGNVVILTVSMPIPCPGAPGKFTVLLDDYLRFGKSEGVRRNVNISFLWPIKLV